MDTETKNKFISFLINSKALTFGNFITKSGRKTPYFINIGNFKYGEQLYYLAKFYAKLIKNSGCKFDLMFGPAYKGISLVVCCSIFLYSEYGLNKQFFFNRKETKDHGEKGQFIGATPKDGDKIIIIEDVLTAGTAVNEVVPILKSNYNIVLNDMFVLVDRCEKGKNSDKLARKEIKDTFNIKLHSLVNIIDIFKYLNSSQKFEKEAKKMESYIDSFCKY